MPADLVQTLRRCVHTQLMVAKDIIAQDGVGGLYKGLGAGLLRQATYTTARLGIFQYISDYLKETNKGKVRGYFERAIQKLHLVNTMGLVARCFEQILPEVLQGAVFRHVALTIKHQCPQALLGQAAVPALHLLSADKLIQGMRHGAACQALY